MSLFEAFATHPDKKIMIEALLIGFVLALIGAGVYVLSTSSMRDDRIAARLSRRPDPWNQANRQQTVPQRQKKSSSNGIKAFMIIFLLVILALIIFILATSLG